MAMIEVDENEYHNNRKARELIDSLWRNQKAKRKLLEAQREVKPEDPAVKELDTPDPVEERFAALASKIEAQEKLIADQKAEREQSEKILGLKKMRDDGLTRLRSEGFTDKGLEGVQKIMDDKGILDPLDAAAIWEKANPTPYPMTPNHNGSWNFLDATGSGESDDIKKLIDTRGESNPLLDKIISDAISDVRRR
jgi:hypothetical protein